MSAASVILASGFRIGLGPAQIGSRGLARFAGEEPFLNIARARMPAPQGRPHTRFRIGRELRQAS